MTSMWKRGPRPRDAAACPSRERLFLHQHENTVLNGEGSPP
ncbi:hypothetical protein [Actinophytocola sp.]